MSFRFLHGVQLRPQLTRTWSDSGVAALKTSQIEVEPAGDPNKVKLRITKCALPVNARAGLSRNASAVNVTPEPAKKAVCSEDLHSFTLPFSASIPELAVRYKCDNEKIPLVVLRRAMGFGLVCWMAGIAVIPCHTNPKSTRPTAMIPAPSTQTPVLAGRTLASYGISSLKGPSSSCSSSTTCLALAARPRTCAAGINTH
mmetsp:Transcript_41650/g.82429  ORF Transcript_41650/g.82429 Transcript_41650/m.82429 type:complete len:200 (+) Transcript_41650:688-1287(+)